VKPINLIGGAVAVAACLSGVPASATNIDDICYSTGGTDRLVLRLTVEYLGQLSAPGETPLQRTYSVAGLADASVPGTTRPVDGSITVARGVGAQMLLTLGPLSDDGARFYGCVGGPSPVPAEWVCETVNTNGGSSNNVKFERVKPSGLFPACRVFAPN
jgi:hypothetical protein